jgi:hypothetical protein
MSAPARLHPADLETLADLVADRLAERLGASPGPADALLTAAQVARRFGVTAEWVRDHAGELGAVRLGDGPRPRLRFALEDVTRALQPTTTLESDSPADGASTRRHRRRARGEGANVELLPIRALGA